jgi:hypothetical protein
MHKNAMKCNETLSKWCKNKHRASKIIDTFETYKDTQDLYLCILQGSLDHRGITECHNILSHWHSKKHKTKQK